MTGFVAKRWHYRPYDEAVAARLAADHHIPHLLAVLLAQREITEETAARFLKPELSHLHDPYQMLGMRTAVERLRRAIANQERILIYGDYDVDGTTAVVVLRTAITLAGIGVYGVLAYGVARRRRELGVRSALGATRTRLIGMVVREGMVVALAGAVAGVAGAAALTPLMQALLFGVEPLDAWSFGAALIVLLCVLCFGAIGFTAIGG